MKGLRALPPALQLSFAIWFAELLARVVFYLAAKDPWPALRFNLTMTGLGFAADVLGIIGMLELARRSTGRVRQGYLVVAAGMGLLLALMIGWELASLKHGFFEHRWVAEVNQYAYFAASTVLLCGAALAASDRPALAIGTLAVGLLTWPPPFLAHHLYSWMPEGKVGLAFQYGLMTVREGLVLVAIASAARGEAVPASGLAQQGFRTAANSLWFRAIGTITIALIIVMAMRAANGASILKFALVAGSLVTCLTLLQFGIGAARVGRAGLAELSPYSATIAGAGSLWAAGVTFDQLGTVYRGFDDLGGSALREAAESLALALPLVVVASVALLAIVIGGFAAHRRAEQLRLAAQSRGIVFVLLTLAAMAAQRWVLADARTFSGFFLLSLIIGMLGLVAMVKMAGL